MSVEEGALVGATSGEMSAKLEVTDDVEDLDVTDDREEVDVATEDEVLGTFVSSDPLIGPVTGFKPCLGIEP